MGSTQNVGSSVSSGREPAAKDSSPMLATEESASSARALTATWHSQLEVRVLHRQPVLDEPLDGDVVLRDEVDRVLLLVRRTRRANLRGAFEDEGASLARERDGVVEDRSELGLCELSVGHGECAGRERWWVQVTSLHTYVHTDFGARTGTLVHSDR